MSAVNVNAHDGVLDDFYQKLLIVNVEGATLDDGMSMMAYETIADVEEDFDKRYRDRNPDDVSVVQFQDDEGGVLDGTLTVLNVATAQRKARHEAVVLVVELLRRIRCVVCREDRNRTVVTFPDPCKGARLVVDVLAEIHEAQTLVFPRWMIEINGVPFEVWDDDHPNQELRVSGLALHGDTGMVQVRILVGTAAEEVASWAKVEADAKTEVEACGRVVQLCEHNFAVGDQSGRDLVSELRWAMMRAKKRAKRATDDLQKALDEARGDAECARHELVVAQRHHFRLQQQLQLEAPAAAPAVAESASAGGCPICLQVITRLCALVPCGHSVCADCMDSAAATGICPMCRGVLGAAVGTLALRVFM